ncbi:MAG: pilus assembly protein [Labilithrix sp.]|nr:pilus assembly protein [Labilithrix sp.]
MKNRARLHHKNRRGAALVEAAVVIPVMLVFLGCIMFAHRSYDVKLDKQMGTRAGILYYGSHNCEGNVPNGIVPNLRNDEADPGVGEGGDKARQGGGKIGGNEGTATQAGLNRSWNLAKAQPQDTPVFGSAVEDRRRVPLNRSIHAESEVACNEKAYESKITAVIQFIGSFAKSGGGFID